MSKVEDAIIVTQEMFTKAKEEYDFWIRELEQHGYDKDNAIVAAQYYGKMCGIAEVEAEIIENGECAKILNTITPKLYDTDYEAS